MSYLKPVDYYAEMVKLTALRSKCNRLKVGAIIVSPDYLNILGIGYNGTPHGFENECECEKGLTKPYVVHAEINAINKVARSNNSTQGAIMFCTHSPCQHCAAMIIQSGISELVYLEDYRDSTGLDMLYKAGIKVRKYE